MDPLIITCAVVGAELTREHTPYLPLTPREIAEEAARAHEAGAAMVHLHGRDPQSGAASQDAAVYAAILRELRRRAPRAIAQVSTGGAVGMSLEQRCGPLEVDGDLRPEMATLTCGTVNFGDEVFENPLPAIRAIASRLRARGIQPEIEIFDAGHLDTALALAAEGVLDPPLHVDFVLGVRGAMAASERNLRFVVEGLPAGWSWSVAGIGRHQLPLAELAIAWGGHVRVGLEDNIYLKKGALAPGNAPLVERAVQLARAAGRPIAGPREARRLLRLAPAVAAQSRAAGAGASSEGERV